MLIGQKSCKYMQVSMCILSTVISFVLQGFFFYGTILGTRFYWFYGFVNLFLWSEQPRGCFVVEISCSRGCWNSAVLLRYSPPAWLSYTISWVKWKSMDQRCLGAQEKHFLLFVETYSTFPSGKYKSTASGRKETTIGQTSMLTSLLTWAWVPLLGLVRALGHSC